MNELYRIRVRGHLDDHWSHQMGEMACQRLADGSTELVGPVVDQAALHGVIERIRDLGLVLVSVTRDIDTPRTDSQGDKSND